jgi:phosphoenolpyruvate carboxylase
MAELEFRQHSQVHAAALKDLAEHDNDLSQVSPQTLEVIDTFRALGAIQRRSGVRAARRYIVSFTQSPEHIRDVYRLAKIAEPNPEDVPEIDAIPLFETMDDLENSVNMLDQIIQFPEVQARLKARDRKMEVMLGYSDSSKDVGPVAATFALHDAQRRIAQWAKRNDIKLTLFHGRGGAIGRGGGPAQRAVLAQPAGSVEGVFKLTEQGEIIFARYGNKNIATSHIETVAGATLLQGSPKVEQSNEEMTDKYADFAADLTVYSRDRFFELVKEPEFPSWFAYVTPLEEVGMLPIGSRPAKRGLSVNSLEDLRSIPWVFSWSQARINLAAWYGFGMACEQYAKNHENGEQRLKDAYKDWNLFTTMVDNMEMSLAKTDVRIAQLYLGLGDNEKLKNLVLSEMELTQKWVLIITGHKFLLDNRPVLGQAVQIRGPYIDVLSLMQAEALRKMRQEKDHLSDQELGELKYLLLCTVSGVSAGLQNTG